MNIEKLREVIRKYEENYDYFNDQAHDEIFKWNAVQHFQNVWLAPKANERSFPELFADARKKCSVLIDNAYVCPSSGVVKIAKKRPDEVEYLFRKVLLAPDGGDIDIRQDNVERFLDEMDRLCRETFPASFKYKQDRHAALCYLTLLKPDDNYIYRYSEAEEFAKHMEFGLDIGSGKSFCLKNYYILCNAVADELRGQRSLLDKVEQRIQEYPAMYYPDKKLHLLTFDLMYCARAYDLYAGMDYKDKAACIREYRQEQKEKQRQQEAAEDVLEQAELFEGERFTIEGQIRSFNNREPTGRRLILCVYALSMTTTDAPMQNEAVLTGTVCKPPVYRQTPLGRQITDLCLAVPRLYRRTDYIPCILWGRTALAAAEYPTGTELTLTGRLQSRTYLKNLGETSETRTAYEFSVSACERVPEFAIF